MLGATGDLTGRLLLPALVRLWHAGELAANFAFVGAGPQDWDQVRFQNHARAHLASHAADVEEAVREEFLGILRYRKVDALVPSDVERLLDTWGDSEPVTLYLALPTHLVAATVDVLEALTLRPQLRIAVEKPFGEDLESAMALNAALARVTAGEHSIFRVDHVLGMPTVADLPSAMAAIRASTASRPGSFVAQISILWEETLALEGRAAFYDRAGALRDLLQNHLLQILCLVTMSHLPETGEDLVAGRLRALKAVRVPTAAQARTDSRRARYTAGQLATDRGASVPDYIAEPGVDPGRQTETLAEATFLIADPLWTKTRFVLRAGKAMGLRRRGVLIEFGSDRAQPQGVDTWIDVDKSAAVPPRAAVTAQVPVVQAAPLEQVAYMNVLRSLLSGSSALSVSAAETELAWRLFTPILEAWRAGEVPLGEYPAGSS